MSAVTVVMPLSLTPEMLRALRQDPTTRIEDPETRYARLGWLLCAWDVLVAARPVVRGADPDTVAREAAAEIMALTLAPRGPGGDVQREAQVQCVVRDAIERVLP